MANNFYIYLYYHNVIGENKVQDFYGQKAVLLDKQLGIARGELRNSISSDSSSTGDTIESIFSFFATEEGKEAFSSMLNKAVLSDSSISQGETAIQEARLLTSQARQAYSEDAELFTSLADSFIETFNSIMDGVAPLFGKEHFSEILSLYADKISKGKTETEIEKELEILITRRGYQGYQLKGDDSALIGLISKIAGLIKGLQVFSKQDQGLKEIEYRGHRNATLISALLGKVWGLLIAAKGAAKEVSTTQGLLLGDYKMLSGLSENIKGKGITVTNSSMEKELKSIKEKLGVGKSQTFGTADVLWTVTMDKVTLILPLSIKNYTLQPGRKTINIKVSDSVSLKMALERSSLLTNTNFMHYFYNIAAAHSFTSATNAGIPTEALDQVSSIGKQFVSEANINKRWKDLIDLIDSANLLYNLSGYSKQNPYGSVMLVVNGKPMLIEDIIERVKDNTLALSRRGKTGMGIANRGIFSMLNTYSPLTDPVSSPNITKVAMARSERVGNSLESKLQEATITSLIKMALS